MARPTGTELLDALESGEVRAAEPTADGWVVHAWVKQGILEIFRSSEVVPQGVELTGLELDRTAHGRLAYRDKGLLSVRRFTEKQQVRLVPGGSAVRRESETPLTDLWHNAWGIPDACHTLIGAPVRSGRRTGRLASRM